MRPTSFSGRKAENGDAVEKNSRFDR